MSNKTTLKLIVETLAANDGRRLTARELASEMVDRNPAWAKQKKERSQNSQVRDGTLDDLKLQVQSEIGSHKPRIEKHINLRMTEDRPRLYYYTKLTAAEEVIEVEASTDPTKTDTLSVFSEKDLYPKLAEFLATELGVYSKRIEESKSSNKNGPKGNKWLHPDLIGLEALSLDWSDTIRTLVAARGDRSSRLWSFEVKKLVNRANVREVFFQTVSNSSWANFAYLVAAEISGTGTLNELRMLAAQHGIGVIQLSTSLDTEGAIVIQARERPEIDWSAADRLSAENPDAAEVFKEVRIFHQSAETHRDFWDWQIEGS